MTQLIKQRFGADCFLCCIAMATGTDYDTALGIWGHEFVGSVSEGGLLGCDAIDRAFRELGYFRDRDYILVPAQVPGSSNHDMAEMVRGFLWGRRACVQVRSTTSHVVYWDGHNLFDPTNGQSYTWEAVEPIYVWLLKG